jgi:hypothetical protein
VILKEKGVWTYPDGRQVCNQFIESGKKEYKRRTRAMWERQKGLCCICFRPIALEQATFEHQDGRGMGGSCRDDRIEKDGRPYNAAACFPCNAAKGSKRVNYHAEPK